MILLKNQEPDVKNYVVFTVQDRDLRNQLVRKGFDNVGEIGDDVSAKKIWTMYGIDKFITKNERAGITLSKFAMKGG